MASETLSVVVDRGYFKSEDILACHDAGITAYVPKPMTSGAKADGRFNNDAFIYDATKNEYSCPAGEALIWRYTNVEKSLTLHRYWSSKCKGCAMKPQCTPSTERRVRRWEHEAVLEEMQNRLSNAPDMMRVRKRTVEHPFGTLKQWMGATHFLTRAERSKCGDELKRPRLQLEAIHENSRYQRFNKGAVGLKRSVFWLHRKVETALGAPRPS